MIRFLVDVIEDQIEFPLALAVSANVYLGPMPGNYPFMIDRECWLCFRALVWTLECGRLNRWIRWVTGVLVVLVVALVGGLALAQEPPPGSPGPQEPPSAPGAPAAPATPGAPEQPATPGIQPTIKGDAAAWAEVEAAHKKLNSLAGYRLKFSRAGVFGSTFVATIEVVPPNSFHTIIESTSFSVAGRTFPATVSESVTVNGQTRFRDKSDGKPWGPWQCVKARPPADTRGFSSQTTIEASRGPDTEIEGTPVRTYIYTLVSTSTSPDKRQRTVTSKTTLYVGAQTGLPRREVFVVYAGSDNRESPPQTIDYYDYDAKIEITLPACEKRDLGWRLSTSRPPAS